MSRVLGGGASGRRWRVLAALAVSLGSLLIGPAVGGGHAAQTLGDGPAPCAAGNPPYPYRGFCATYNGANTFFGSYGPGFPTPLGWGICAFRAGAGGSYPAPGYGYLLTDPPVGGDPAWFGALGYGFSEASVALYWDGKAGAYTADQAAVAAKLLYDVLVWHTAVPQMDPGVLAAYVQLDLWVLNAAGASGSPELTVGLVGGGTTFTHSTTLELDVAFPGSGASVGGVGVIVSLSGATFDGSGGQSISGGMTDGNGSLSLPITATGSGAVTVTTSSAASVGQLGLRFYGPTRYVLNAQDIVAGPSPTVIIVNSTFQAQGPPPSTGAIAIRKSGNDTAYFPIAGARFDIMRGTTVVGSLITNAAGRAGPSSQLPLGAYTIHESVPPPGYEPAPDQLAQVLASQVTTVNFTAASGDVIIPAAVTMKKVDRYSGGGLAGAIFDVAFDPANTGSYSVDLGQCTTGFDGSCSPATNDGPDLLPGDYRITELRAPPGYYLDPARSVQDVAIDPGETGSVVFADPPFVPQSFIKVATGNVDETRVILAGASFVVIDSQAGIVATCTTDANGSCSTAASLIAGQDYCWRETATPPGLVGGAAGCFTAGEGAAPIPITVIDEGDYVAIEAKKVDAADQSSAVPGATFDLYRDDGGAGPTPPVPPPDAALLPGKSWMARSISGSGAIASFPLQLPDYAYCVVEHAAPPGYVLDPSPRCSAVLRGVTSSPPTTVTLIVADPEATTSLSVQKWNAMELGQGVPGATYDLYVQDPAPPSTPSVAPAAAAAVAGSTWYASGVTSSSGHLRFSIPLGHAWCVLERSGPPEYVLDTARHCTAVIDQASPDAVRMIAIVEIVSTVTIDAYKYNALAPGETVPGASYALFVEGPMPPGFIGPTAPAGLVEPGGMALFATGTTDGTGHLRFTVPIGHRWCLSELYVPAGYRIDSGLHCTARLEANTPSLAMLVGLPELPFTGGLLPLSLGATLLTAGASLIVASRRQRAGGR